jgi:hypothetical protein
VPIPSLPLSALRPFVLPVGVAIALHRPFWPNARIGDESMLTSHC